MSEQAEGLRGAALAAEVIGVIHARPEDWNQRDWHCGTRHCFGGHCQIRGGRPERADGVYDDVQDLLGVSTQDAHWLCHGDRTFAELRAYVQGLVDGVPYFDDNGYARDGSTRSGGYSAQHDRALYPATAVSE